MKPEPSNKPARYRIGDLVVDTGTRRVSRDDKTLKLGGLTFDLLLALIECAPNIASHDELAERVWQGRPVTPETIAQRAKLLRDALSDDSKNPRYCEPIRGQGYRLCCAVETLAPAQSGTPRARSRVTPLLGLAAIVVIALISAWLMPRDRAPVSLAVIPLEVIGEDADQHVFAGGLTAEILNTLAQIDDLRVTAPTSSLAFQGSNQTTGEIAAALGVELLFIGSVRISGDTIRVSARLIRARDDSHMWSDTFDRNLADTFRIQEDIAAAVADVLEIKLGVGELGTRPGMTRNIDAWQLYLQAFEPLSELYTDTERSVRATVTLLQRAIAIDQDFALAWLAIARSYIWGITLAQKLPPEIRDEWALNSAYALERALELAPDSVEISAYAAEQALQRGEWSESRRLLLDLTDNASNGAFESEVQRVYGLFLRNTGSPLAAVQALERARWLDPLNGATALFLGDAYLVAGDLEAALDEFDRGLTLPGNPGEMLRGTAVLAALATGDQERIRERLTQAASYPSPGNEFDLLMRELIDDPHAAIAEMRRLHTEAGNASSLAHGVAAYWIAHFGDAGYALERLNEIPLPIDTVVVSTAIWRPAMADVRMLPGFLELLEDMGLADFWREFGWPEMCGPTGDNSFSCR